MRQIVGGSSASNCLTVVILARLLTGCHGASLPTAPIDASGGAFRRVMPDALRGPVERMGTFMPRELAGLGASRGTSTGWADGIPTLAYVQSTFAGGKAGGQLAIRLTYCEGARAAIRQCSERWWAEGPGQGSPQGAAEESAWKPATVGKVAGRYLDHSELREEAVVGQYILQLRSEGVDPVTLGSALASLDLSTLAR